MKQTRQHDPEKVIHVIVSENVGTSSMDITNDYDLSNIGGLEAANIVFDIEDELLIKLDPKLFNFKTVGELVSYVQEKLKLAAA